MDRRLFVQASVSSLLLPTTVLAVPSGATGRSQATRDYFFFDERFAAARRLAGERSIFADPTPVQGDVTGIWTSELRAANLATALRMQGVTTESFYFCLRILLSDQARPEAQVRRIDRDLHLWTLRTDNHIKTGTTSWQNHSRPV